MGMGKWGLIAALVSIIGGLGAPQGYAYEVRTLIDHRSGVPYHAVLQVVNDKILIGNNLRQEILIVDSRNPERVQKLPGTNGNVAWARDPYSGWVALCHQSGTFITLFDVERPGPQHLIRLPLAEGLDSCFGVAVERIGGPTSNTIHLYFGSTGNRRIYKFELRLGNPQLRLLALRELHSGAFAMVAAGENLFTINGKGGNMNGPVPSIPAIYGKDRLDIRVGDSLGRKVPGVEGRYTWRPITYDPTSSRVYYVDPFGKVLHGYDVMKPKADDRLEVSITVDFAMDVLSFEKCLVIVGHRRIPKAGEPEDPWAARAEVQVLKFNEQTKVHETIQTELIKDDFLIGPAYSGIDREGDITMSHAWGVSQVRGLIKRDMCL